jgi:site-specific DNA recombinase
MPPQFTSATTRSPHTAASTNSMLRLGRRRKKYGRNSSDEQHRMATILSQIEAVDDWDRANGGDPRPEDWYIDEGWSGFTLERPELDRLRDDAANPARDWDELIIYDTSRFSRDPIHRLAVLEPEMAKLGVKIIYVASPIFEDTADGRFMAWQQAGMDKWFAEKNRENLRRGLRRELKKGKCWWAPYGYRVERRPGEDGGRHLYLVTIYEPEAEIVREIFTRVIAGEGSTEIARSLNARGVPSAKGGTWSARTITKVIHNRYYIGTAGFGKNEYVLPATRHPKTPRFPRKPKSLPVRRPEEEWWGKASVPPIIDEDTLLRAGE